MLGAVWLGDEVWVFGEDETGLFDDELRSTLPEESVLVLIVEVLFSQPFSFINSFDIAPLQVIGSSLWLGSLSSLFLT